MLCLRAVLSSAAFAVFTSTGGGAQAVTLPTIRVSNTPEMALLDRLIGTVQLSAAMSALRRSEEEVNCDLAKVALAPFTKAEVANADVAASKDKAVRADLLRATRPAMGGIPEPMTSLAAVFGKPLGQCDLSRAQGDSDIRRILEPYLAAEHDIEKHARLDSLQRVAVANVIRRTLHERHWFPVKSHDEAAAFWRQPAVSSLNIGAISGAGDQGAAFAEVTSRFLHVFRLSFNTVLAAANDSNNKVSAANSSTAPTPAGGPSGSAIARFLNGGGLFNLSAAYPVVHYGSLDGFADFLTVFAPRLGGTLPVLGATQRDTTLLCDLGTEFVFKTFDFADHVGAFSQIRAGWASGSDKFMELIGEPSRHGITYLTLTGGLGLDEKFVITLSKTIAGPRSFQHMGWQIGVSLARAGASPEGGSQ